MARQVTVEDLNSLIQLDIDASYAYSQAIANIPEDHIRSQLITYRSDHERHIDDLSVFVRRMGGEPVRYSKDVKGFLLAGFTRLRSLLGTEQALKAMKSNEKLTNSRYDDALTWELPQELRTTIQRNRDDERRHLEYIERALDQRLWQLPEKIRVGATADG